METFFFPGESLLVPTKIYISSLLSVMKSGMVKAAAHITGGGLPGNVERVLPASLGAALDASMWPMPPVFGWLSAKVWFYHFEIERNSLIENFCSWFYLWIAVSVAHECRQSITAFHIIQSYKLQCIIEQRLCLFFLFSISCLSFFQGNISVDEMLRTFNCGIGMVVVTDYERSNQLLNLLNTDANVAFRIGLVNKHTPGKYWTYPSALQPSHI